MNEFPIPKKGDKINIDGKIIGVITDVVKINQYEYGLVVSAAVAESEGSDE